MDANNEAGRAAARALAGKLRDNRVKRSTLTRYLHAFHLFLCFLAQSNMPFATDSDALELQLIQFIESLWEEGKSKGLAGDVLSGCQHFLATRRRSPGSWKLLVFTWSRLEVPACAPPFPLQLILAICGIALGGMIRLLCSCVGFTAACAQASFS